MRKSTIRTLAASTAAIALAIAAPALAQSKADTLRAGVNASNTFLGNPFMARGVPIIYFNNATYDTLTIIGPQGDVRPLLAESWKVVDHNTWQFKLKNGAVFTNGKPNDAANFAKVISFLQSDSGKSMQMGRVLMEVATAKDIGNNTVEIKTKTPQPLLHSGALADVFVIEADALASMGMQEYSAKPVTSGPWRVVSYSPEQLVGTAFDKALRPAKIKNLDLRSMPEAVTRVQALSSDQMDFVSTLTPEDVKTLKAAGHGTEMTPAPQTMTVAFYEQKPGFNPFKDRRVRMAANMAFDRKAITEGLMSGLTQPAHQAATPRTKGYIADIKPYPFDPEGAKKLLAEAGYPNGFDTAMQVTVGSLPYDKEIYTLVGDALTKIGIRTKVIPIQLSELTALLFKQSGKEFEGHMFGFSAFVDPDLDAVRPFMQHGCNFKPAWVCIESLEKLTQAANSEFDETKRLALLKQLVQLGHDEAAMINIQHGIDIYGINKRLVGYTNWNRRIMMENFEIKG